MSPLVSVVIPLYNKEEYICRAVDSVLSQTISDFELIIVDGHSQDKSIEKISGYTDERIILFSQEGAGVSTARNQAIEKASAEIVAFLDADDEWKPDFLETILNLHKKYPRAGMFGTAYSVYSDDKFVHDIVVKISDEKVDDIFESYYHEFVKAGHPIIITSAFAAKRDVLMSLGGYPEDLKIGEDHELFGKIALYYPVAYSSNVCSKYNLGSDNNADVVNYKLEVPLLKYLESVDLNNVSINSHDLDEYMDHWRLRMGGRNVYSGFRKEGRKQLQEITNRQHAMMKYIFLIMSYLPIKWSLLSPKMVRDVLRTIGLSI